MNLEPIAQYLEDNGCGKQGVSIFVGQMPVDKTGILLKPPYRGTEINYELPNYFKGEFALIVRGKGAAATEKVMAGVMKFFSIQSDTQIGNMAVKYLRARTLPVSYPIPASGLQEVVANIDCCFVLTYDK